MERVFRPQPLLGVAMAVAAAFWLSIASVVTTHPIVPFKTVVSTWLFVALFLASVTYYARTAVRVDAAGVKYQGLFRSMAFSFNDIQHLHVLPGLITLYMVQAGHKSFAFTSLFQRHRELLELLRARAGLSTERSS